MGSSVCWLTFCNLEPIGFEELKVFYRCSSCGTTTSGTVSLAVAVSLKLKLS